MIQITRKRIIPSNLVNVPPLLAEIAIVTLPVTDVAERRLVVTEFAAKFSTVHCTPMLCVSIPNSLPPSPMALALYLSIPPDILCLGGRSDHDSPVQSDRTR